MLRLSRRSGSQPGPFQLSVAKGGVDALQELERHLRNRLQRFFLNRRIKLERHQGDPSIEMKGAADTSYSS